MIRKQLYIEARQEQALKARARELGVTEAEIVRDALARALNEPATINPTEAARAARIKRMAELDAELDAATQEASPPQGYRFTREDAYDEPRLTRWNQPPAAKRGSR